MNRRDGSKVLAVLTKATEVKSVQEPDRDVQLLKNAILGQHFLKNVLLFHASGLVLSCVPSFEQGDGLVVGPHHVETCVDRVGFGAWIAVEVVSADLKIYALVVAQPVKWVP